jgi:Putative beta-barrel porin 2
MPANTPVTPNSPAPDNSQSQKQNNPQAPDASQVGFNPQAANGTQSQIVPLLPQTGSGTYTFSPTSTEPQSSLITSPALHNTGMYDLSQVASEASLLQAFGSPVASLQNPDAYGPIQRIRLGPVDLKFNLSMAVVNDDNILAGQSSNGEKPKSDTSLTVTPAVLIEYGNHDGQKGHASIVYSPQLSRYFRYSAEDTDNQNVSFQASYPFQRLSLDISETYAQTTGINFDTNTRTTQTSNVQVFGGSYEIDDKFSVTSHLQELKTEYAAPGGASSTSSANNQANGNGVDNAGGEGEEDTSVNTTIAYHLSDKITLGPSVNVGLDRPENDRHQTYEQGLLGVNYQPTEKLGIYGQGGIEFRQYDHGPSVDNPIFSAGLNYAPIESMSINLSGSQTVSPSTAESSETSMGESFGASITQRFFQKYFLGFAFDYQHAEYSTNSDTLTPQEESAVATFGSRQDSFSYRPSLTFNPTEWTSVSLYYQYRSNETDSKMGGYHDNQLGISVSAQF